MNINAPWWWPPDSHWTCTWAPTWHVTWAPAWAYCGPSESLPAPPSEEEEEERPWTYPRKHAKREHSQRPSSPSARRKPWFEDIADDSGDEPEQDPAGDHDGLLGARPYDSAPPRAPPSKKARPSSARTSAAPRQEGGWFAGIQDDNEDDKLDAESSAAPSQCRGTGSSGVRLSRDRKRKPGPTTARRNAALHSSSDSDTEDVRGVAAAAPNARAKPCLAPTDAAVPPSGARVGKPCPAQVGGPFWIGQTVIARELTSARGAHLNGRRGKVSSLVRDGRVGVDFGDIALSLSTVNVTDNEQYKQEMLSPLRSMDRGAVATDPAEACAASLHSAASVTDAAPSGKEAKRPLAKKAVTVVNAHCPSSAAVKLSPPEHTVISENTDHASKDIFENAGPLSQGSQEIVLPRF